MSIFQTFNLGGSEIIIIFIYLALLIFAFFIIKGIKAFFEELNK